MDLRSIINQSSSKAATTAPVSPQSFQQTAPTYQRHESSQSVQRQPGFRERPPQPPPLRPPDHSPGPGPYHAPSPYHTLPPGSATLSAGGQPNYSHSPGSHAQPNTARDVPPLQHQYSSSSFAPSPSPLTRPSPTPTTPHPYQYHQRQSSSNSIAPPPPTYNQPYPSRENSIPPSALPHSQSSLFSPPPQLYSQPGTPLGPPGPYQRPSPQVQKPVSHGFDHYRTYSSGSIGSQHGLEYTERNITSPQQPQQQLHQQPPHQQPPPLQTQAHSQQQQPQQQSSRESLQRQLSIEQDRERTQSVSPKTIPQPPPRRQLSHTRSHTASESHMEGLQRTPTPISASLTPKDLHLDSSQPSSAQQSPAPASAQFPAPKDAPASLPPKNNSPMAQKLPSLKRNASAVSGASASPPPSRKRLRRDQVPIFARSARANKKPVNLSFGKASGSALRNQPVLREEKPQRRAERTSGDPVNGSAPANGILSHDPAPAPDSAGWEPSITNVMPYEDLTRWLCDRIFATIGMAKPPAGGAMFEIEAKLGEIHDVEEGRRLRLPIGTEAVFEKSNFRSPTRFESSMNMAQHKKLNDFLNSQVQESHESPNRTPIMFDHPKESDEFYELTPAGQAHLPTSILQYLNPRHKPRVRITTNLETQTVKARIIKSRIADFEIFNPQESFDYRISISIESPWEGTNDMLIPTNEGGERNKDRMSYRHLAYQIDLTQVSYPATSRKEHELEVEISTEQIRTELAKLQAGEPSNYEALVRGFLDNVRLLARKGTLK